MSLTRAQWEHMWNTTKKLEGCVLKGIPDNSEFKKVAKTQVTVIKALIQEAVGQME